MMVSTGIDLLNEQVFQYLSSGIRQKLASLEPAKLLAIEEVRLRSGRPLILNHKNGDWLVEANTAEGRIMHANRFWRVDQEEIAKTLEIMSDNSVYAYQDDIKNGFLTLKGGHRVGISGKAVMDGQTVKNIKEVSGLNIRIAKEVKCCSDKALKHMVLKQEGRLLNTLIVSPPRCGKTTMIRDLARNLSNGTAWMDMKGMKVGIVDERSEIASCHKGIPQFDIGIRTDVLDNCPKALGMEMMIRAMSPEVIITDEIGGESDRNAILHVVNAGVKIIATAHGYNISELESRYEVIDLLNRGVFEICIVLSGYMGPGTIEEIVDCRAEKVIYKRTVATAVGSQI